MTCDTTINVGVSLGIAHQLISLQLLLQEGWMMKSVQKDNPINGILKLQHEKQEHILMVMGISKGNTQKFDELTSIDGCVIQLQCAI